MSIPKPVVLCILDGWGLRDEVQANAPKLAKTPTFDRIMATCPNATLVTHGPDVGLPTGQMGNSEVGHTNIGAGRVVAMDLGQIDLAIENGSFPKNEALNGFIDTLKKTGGIAHLAGLTSPGGVHSHQRHIAEAARVVAGAGVPVLIHAITDGRDVPPKSAAEQLAKLEADLPEGAQIATVIGRYYAMDRDTRWDRVEKAWSCIREGKGHQAASAVEAVEAAYARGETDEFILPTTIGGYSGVHSSNDGLFVLNFRADRVREILQSLVDPDFDGFARPGFAPFAVVLGMVEYSDHLNRFQTTVYPKQNIVNTLGSWVAQHGLRQFRLAETEKYPHVTFFLNGGKEVPETGEDRYMAPSPKVATYDLQPEMAAEEVTDHFVQAIRDKYDLIVVNYANPDMVGHTGDLDAAIAAVEAVDQGLARVVDALRDVGGAMVLTADHGNCETMVNPETGGPHTSHTTNPVPVAVYGGPAGCSVSNGRLADIAPTLLDLMGLELPPEMTGKSLIRK